jgi:hypothetical protein
MRTLSKQDLAEGRREAEAFTREAFEYIRSRPKSRSPLYGFTFDDARLTSAEALRVCDPASLPAPVQAELRRLRIDNADDQEVLDAILEMEWQDNPCAVARRDAALRAEKAKSVMLEREFNLIQLEAAHRGFLWRDGDWVHVSDL